MTPRNDYQMEMCLAPDEIIVDSFAGGGGASLGISWALGRGPHIAINHDKEAIALHAANHPESEHHPEDVWHVDPVKACAGRKVGLMWLSPDCKHFSKAKGGKPVSKKIRGLAWTACRWAKAVHPRVIVLENVEEFKDWGPLIKVGGEWRPDPEKKGHTFNRFVARLRRLDYVVEWKELRACDFGAPTIRKRFFLIARCDGRPIVWPEPTHGKGRALPWRTAAECIDWSIECPSIFERVAKGKKALAENTCKRIARGIQRFVIDAPKPFIVQYHSAKRPGDDRIASLEGPLGTQTVENRFGIVTPIIAGVGGRAGQSPERRVDQPYQTITAKADAAVVSPLLVPMQHENRATSLAEPLQTVTTQGNKFNVVSPLLVPIDNQSTGDAGARSGADPLSTVTAEARHAIAVPHLVSLTHHGGDRVEDVSEPMMTVTGAHRGEKALVTGFLKPRYGEREGQAPRVRSLEEPAPVIVPTANGGDLVAAFMAQHNTDVVGHRMTDPVSTIVGKGCTQAPVTVDLEPVGFAVFHCGGCGYVNRFAAAGWESERCQACGELSSGDVTYERVPTWEEWIAAAKDFGGTRAEYDALYGAGDPEQAEGNRRIAAHIAKHYGGRVGSDAAEPLHTVTAESVHHALVSSNLVKLKGTAKDGQAVDEPLHTVQAGGQHYAEVRAFMVAYYGNEKDGGSLHDPARTVTSKERFGLVTVDGIDYAIVDIGMRMLAPRELYTAQGFPPTYRIEIPYTYTVTRKRKGKKVTITVTKPLTKTAQVRMCGNSVCPPMAAAIVSANLLGQTFAPPSRRPGWDEFIEEEIETELIREGKLEEVA